MSHGLGGNMTGFTPAVSTRFHAEVIENTAADLRALSKAAGLRTTKHDLRQTSVLVRSLAEGTLRDAWRYAGLDGQPEIPCQSFASHYDAEFAFIGGAVFKEYDAEGRHYGGPRISYGQEDGSHSTSIEQESATEFCDINGNIAGWIDQTGNSALVNHSLRLDRFWDDNVLIIDGLRVSRRSVVKYVANRRGGAHLKTAGGKQKTEAVFDALDSLTTTRRVLGPVAPVEMSFYSLMTIVHYLTEAPDIARFLERADSLIRP